jgi:hypothetical protein
MKGNRPEGEESKHNNWIYKFSSDQTLFNLVRNGVAIIFKGSLQFTRRPVTRFNNTRDLGSPPPTQRHSPAPRARSR